jgi:hypothetical protein
MGFVGGIVGGRFFEGDEYFAAREIERKRSALAAPRITSDYIEGAGSAVKSMVDGRMYDSKSALRRHYRERGYIEVGNERQEPPPKPKPDRKAIRNSVGSAMVRAGISVDG